MSDMDVETTPSGRIVKLEVEGFKSFGGKHTVEFRQGQNFTAVVGPNGAGKSNLMDAISYVLGLQARHLRSSKLIELLHRGPSATKRKAAVTLTYEREGDEVVFSRTISAVGVGAYWLDTKEVTREKYEGALKDIGVLVKARNFLVFQGDVESLASKTQEELTAVLEQVSGSVDHKKDYDKLKTLKDAAEASSLLAYQKKKGLAAQRRQVRDQRDEADAYESLRDELNAARKDDAVSRVAQLRDDRASKLREKASLDSEVQKGVDAVTKAASKESRASDALKEASLNAQRADAALAQKTSSLRGGVAPRVAAAREAAEQASRDAAAEKAASTQAEAAAATHVTLVSDLEKEQATEDAEIQRLQEERQRDEPAWRGDQTLVDEVSDLQAQVERETASRAFRLDAARRARDTEEADVEALQREVDDVLKRRNEASSEADAWRLRAKASHNAALKADTDVRGTADAISAAEAAYQVGVKEVARAQGDVDKAEAELRDCRDHLPGGPQAQRDLERARLVETLRSLFPGVRGRVADVCEPTSRTYAHAVGAAMGALADAVVVDARSTAVDCVRHLREHRLGAMTFLPLDALSSARPDERLRNLGRQYRPALDVVACDEGVKAAVAYAVGVKTVVCDTLDDARRLAYAANGPSVKAVSVQGAVIAPSGTMAGGHQQGGARAWRRADAARLERERASKQEALAHARLQAQALKDAVAPHTFRRDACASTAKWAARDAQLAQSRVAECEAREKALGASKATADQERDAKVPARDAAVQAHNELRQAKRVVEERVYGAFSKRHGLTVDDLCDDGDAVAGTPQALRKQRDDALKTHLQRSATLRAQLEYEQGRDLQARARELKARAKDASKAAAKAKKAALKIEAEQSTAEDELQVERRAAKDARQAHDIARQALKKCQVDARRAADAKQAAARKAQSASIAVDAVSAKLQDVARRARLEHVSLGQDENTDPEELDVSTAQKPKRGEDADQAHARRRRAIEDLERRVDALAPNLRAKAQFDALSGDVEAADKELAASRDAARDAARGFDGVRRKRTEAFRACFDVVASTLAEAYQDVTKSARHPSGGAASLHALDAAEPYLAGVSFHATPPAKRFCEISQLSGGERTLASLALLFALHAYRPAPFLVMDEVDAALDSVNVAKLAAFVKRRARTLQIVAVSLKDQFYTEADALIGVAKDSARAASVPFTLDLGTYA